MIADRLDNIGLYDGVSTDISAGLIHLKTMDENVPLGTYQLTEKIKVIVSLYTTEANRKNEYEAHRKVIDIQYPIAGREQVMWSPVRGMELAIDYNPVKDAAYWRNPVQPTSLITGEGVFAIFFPEDAHRPCMAVDGQEELIKKVTLKISI